MNLQHLPLSTQLGAVLAKCDALETENADLKRALGRERSVGRCRALCAQWKLTPREGDLMVTLYATRHRLLTKEALMDALYQGAAEEPEIKIIDVWICKIRRKIGHGFIQTHWGQGYRLTPAGADAITEVLGTLA